MTHTAAPPTPHAGVQDAVARARAAQPAWGQTPPRDRAHLLGELRRVLVQSADLVVATVGEETGKAAADVAMAEVLQAAGHLDWLARNAERVLASRRVSARPLVAKRAVVHRRPRGVAAVLSPWNYPFLLALQPTASALAAGCAVVLKPSERTPSSGALVARLVAEAGGPDGLVQVLRGGPETGAALVRADVDVISVTGSAATGRSVSEAAAARLTPVITELGGNDPMVVLADADLRRAARAAVFGACFNAGQSCVAVERVYVVQDAYERFLRELDDAFAAVRAGGGGRGDVGPLIGPHQGDVLERHVSDALGRGAVLRRGGRRFHAGGRDYFEPTLLTDVPQDSLVMREESFGPVLPVRRVADAEEAVRLAADSAYGLHASVWTRDIDRAHDIARRLRVGAVAVNDVLVNFAMSGVPFGGVGASGAGRQGGDEGLLAYCFTQSVTVGRFDPPRELQWFPRVAGPRAVTAAARLLYGRRAPRARRARAPRPR